jgi:hypothetical protein
LKCSAAAHLHQYFNFPRKTAGFDLAGLLKQHGVCLLTSFETFLAACTTVAGTKVWLALQG